MTIVNLKRKTKLCASITEFSEARGARELNMASISKAIETKRTPQATIVGAIASPIVICRRNLSITPVSMSFGIQTNSEINDAIIKKIASPNVHFCCCNVKKWGTSKTDPLYPLFHDFHKLS